MTAMKTVVWSVEYLLQQGVILLLWGWLVRMFYRELSAILRETDYSRSEERAPARRPGRVSARFRREASSKRDLFVRPSREAAFKNLRVRVPGLRQ